MVNQVKLAAGNEKRTPCWNHDVKVAIRVRKILLMPCFKLVHHLICNHCIPRKIKLQLRNVQRTLLGGVYLSVEFQLFVLTQSI